MPKLYWKYGVMGSSKTANALMVEYNYKEKNKKVLLMKPSIDTRDGKTTIKSRIGLESQAETIKNTDNLLEVYENITDKPDVIIIDESQFLTEQQVNQLKDISIKYIPVICYGLRTDFQSKMFEGSKRLFEIADSIQEIKSVCKCGRKAVVNARIKDGHVVYNGSQIQLGGNESYIGVCYDCWKKGNI